MRTEVKSSLLQSVGYDPATRTLELQFKPKKDGEPGKVYSYANVDESTYEKFRSAPSLGSHFLKNIKGSHPCTRVEEKPDAESEKKAATKPQPFQTATDDEALPF